LVTYGVGPIRRQPEIEQRSEIEMKPTTGSRHLRDRNRKSHLPSKSRAFSSNGTEVRFRASAHQLFEKYLALARDAQAAGDRIAAENYSQHAEHYFRIINANAEGNWRSRYHQQPEGTAQPQSAAAPAAPRPLTNGSGNVLRDIDLENENESEPGSPLSVLN
jgi:uncharacterized protein DUF4167